jgi:hypothetical protein
MGQQTINADFAVKEKVGGEATMFGLTHTAGQNLHGTGIHISMGATLALHSLAHLFEQICINVGCCITKLRRGERNALIEINGFK